MTAKEYLSELQKMQYRIKNLKLESESLRESFTYLSGINYERDKVQTSPRDVMADSIDRIVDVEKEVALALAEYHEAMSLRIRQINGLSKPEYITILTSRYVEGKNFEQIAVELDYNYYHTCHLHGEALDEFAKTYKIQ